MLVSRLFVSTTYGRPPRQTPIRNHINEVTRPTCNLKIMGYRKIESTSKLGLPKRDYLMGPHVNGSSGRDARRTSLVVSSSI